RCVLDGELHPAVLAFGHHLCDLGVDADLVADQRRVPCDADEGPFRQPLERPRIEREGDGDEDLRDVVRVERHQANREPRMSGLTTSLSSTNSRVPASTPFSMSGWLTTHAWAELALSKPDESFIITATMAFPVASSCFRRSSKKAQ